MRLRGAGGGEASGLNQPEIARVENLRDAAMGDRASRGSLD
jgi:hypothetical protein